MSKLSFRARALDAYKPMPIYYIEEVPDFPDFAAINRAVPQMPTGMEKEEECEHHLQRAMSAQQAYGHTGELVIPTPEVYEVPKEFLQVLYPTTYKHPRQLIHVQPFSMEQDIPEYDMDSEDEKWLSEQAEKMDIKPLQFEQMMDRLESSSGQQVVTLKEAKLLLKEDDDLLIAVYDYWLNKRLRTAHPLIAQVKSEKRDGSTNNNPYVAFRRRTEKMQTRKNRKNDEASYEKMLKLKRDLVRAGALLEMIRKREKLKRENLHLTVEIFEKRYQAGDFGGQLLSEVMAMKFTRPPPIIHSAQKPPIINKPEIRIPSRKPVKTGAQKKRTYKRKTKSESAASRSAVHRTDLGFGDAGSSDEEAVSPAPSDQEEETDPDGPYAFKRKKNCNYLAPLERLGNYPWCSKEENGLADKRFRYCLTSIPVPNRMRCIGFSRRRLGRGGRIIFDRAYTPMDEYWDGLDNITNNMPNGLPKCNELLTEIETEWKWFRPQNPAHESSSRLDQNDSDSDEVGASVRRRNFNTVNRTSSKIPIDLNRNVQCNQEELFEMQRKQLERLKAVEPFADSSSLTGAEHSFLSQPTSRFTIRSLNHQMQYPHSTVITHSDTTSSCPSSPTQIPGALPDSSSIRNPRDRIVLTNGPVNEDILVYNNHTNIDKLLKEICEVNHHSSTTPPATTAAAASSASLPDVKPNLEILQQQLAQSTNFSWPAVPSTVESHIAGGVVVGTAAVHHPSASRHHVIQSKTALTATTAPQTELRFINVEQNGNEGRVKKELFLSKVKVEKVNDSTMSMDVT